MIEAFGALAAILNSVVGVLNLVILLAGIISLKKGIQVVHLATNSMKDQLVDEVRIAALAKGKLDEQNREKR
jgi:hypothetical protein